MGNHFHDNNGWLIAGMDGHFGIHWPFVPMWFYSVNLLHPFVLGNKQRPTVIFNGVSSVAVQHEPKYLWPHIGVIPDPLDLLTPVHIFFGTHRAWLPKVSVIGQGEPLAVCAIADAVSVNLDCWDFGHLPTSLVLNDGTVETTATWADYKAGLTTALINLAIEGAIFLATMGVGHLFAKGLSSVFEGLAEDAEAGLRDAAESLEGGEQDAAAAADGATVEGGEPGGSSEPPPGKCGRVGEPVDVASGAVVDAQTDLALPGAFPLEWRRTYSSKRARQRTALGKGGWSHSFEQWVIAEDHRITLRNDEGRDVWFAALEPGKSAFHRAERLTLTALEGGRFTVHSLDTRLTREFAPASPGGRALLRAIRDAWGNTIALEYTGDKLHRITDTAGREVRVKLDAMGRVVRLEVWVTGALELWFDYAYHASGELAKAQNALDHAEHYSYDDDRRLTKKTLRNGTSFYYAYDDKTGWCVRTWGDGELHRVELRPDLEARITETIGTEEPRIYAWNEQGVVIREAAPDGSFLRVRVYDEDLYLLSEENGAGQKTRYEYDARGNRTKLVDPAGNVTEWAYEADLPVMRVDPAGATTRFEHDERRSLARIVFSNGQAYSLRHDSKGRMEQVSDDEGALLTFRYGPSPRSVAELDARGGTTIYGYDPLGRPIAKTDPLGRTTRVEYDRIGNPIAIHRPDGRTLHAEHDGMGRVTRATDALGGVTCVDYAGTGTVAQVILPDGSKWQFRRTRQERVREVVNPLGETYAFRRDQAGRVREERTFDGRLFRYEYSRAGRLSRVLYPDRTERALEYDVLGNVILESSAEGRIVFERDHLGRVQKAIHAEAERPSTISYERDARGRVVAETRDDRTVRYAYDRLGRRAARTLPDGSTTRYGYDRVGNVTSVDHRGTRLDLRHDAAGRELLRTTESGSMALTSAYDARGLLAGQRLSVKHEGRTEAEIAVDRAFHYDGAGRVVEITDALGGGVKYEYDEVGRLVSALREGHHEVFSYDAAGTLRAAVDRFAGEAGGGPWRVQRGDLLCQTELDRYEYDARGRRTRRTSRSGEVTEYVWDTRDRLRAMRLPNGSSVRLFYDAFGRRTRKEVTPANSSDARVTEYVWDGDAIAADTAPDGVVRTFVCVPKTLIPMLQHEGDRTFVVVTDHVGAPQELVDARAGEVTWKARRSAWGRAIGEAGSPSSPFGLLGQYRDEDIGLAVTRFRYFDDRVARWLSPDPLGLAGGRNPFSYNGAPTVDTDPLGLQNGLPFGFDSAEQFAQFGAKIDEHLNGLVNYYEAYVQGSAATGFSYHEPGRPFGPESDIDLAVASKDLFDAAASEPEADIRGFSRTAPNPLPDMLDPLRADLSEMLGGREVNIVVFDTRRAALDRATSIKVPKPCGF